MSENTPQSPKPSYRYSFNCDFLDADPDADNTFNVIVFKGFEAISKPYEIDVLLAAQETIDMELVIKSPVHFTIECIGETTSKREFHGILSQFEMVHATGTKKYFRAILVPKIWGHSLNINSRAFSSADNTVADFVTLVLREDDFLMPSAAETGSGKENYRGDFRFELSHIYPARPFVCQYKESNLNFISRWLEHYGLYYYFGGKTDHGDSQEMIISDSMVSDDSRPVSNAALCYLTDSLGYEKMATHFTCRRNRLPGKLRLEDYNYFNPQSGGFFEEITIDSNSPGTVYSYNDNIINDNEKTRLMTVREEELTCRGTLFSGQSFCPDLSAGYNFTLADHSSQFDQSYLLTEIRHEGINDTFKKDEFVLSLSSDRDLKSYKNYFTAIPSDKQFRPQRTTLKPMISGTIHGFTDGKGSADSKARMDDQGRYKVCFAFGSAVDEPNKSHFIPMLQPNSGPVASAEGTKKSGFHLPLLKDTQVLLSFVNGDPDRPVISGTLPNAHTRSPVNNSFPIQNRNIIRDHYGNEMVFDTTTGNEHIRLYSPNLQSGMRIGSNIDQWTTGDKNTYQYGSSSEWGIGARTSGYLGSLTDLIGGTRLTGTLGYAHDVLVGGAHSWTFGYRWDWSKGPAVQSTSKDAMTTAKEDVIIGAGDEFCLAAGTQQEKSEASPKFKKGNIKKWIKHKLDYDRKAAENKSIIRATRKGITLSLGKDLTETAEGDGKANWFKESKSGLFEFENDTKWALANLTAVSAFTGFMAGLPHPDSKTAEDDAMEDTMSGMASACQLAALITFIGLYRSNLADSKIEPVTHKAPPQKIWMHKDGTIGMVSTYGGVADVEDKDFKKFDGAQGKVLLGVNEQKVWAGEGEAEAQEYFYNTHTRFQDKVPATAKEKLKKKLGILEKAKETHSVVLGKGSNILIKKDSLLIRSQKADGTDNLSIHLDNTGDNGKGIKIEAKHPADATKKTELHFDHTSGNIKLSNKTADDSTGTITIESNEKILLQSTGKKIVLDAGADGGILFRSKANFEDQLIHQNFKVLK